MKTESWANVWPAKLIQSGRDFCVCPFEGGDSDVVDSLIIVAPIFGGFCVFGPCFVVRYLESALAVHAPSWGRERAGCIGFNCLLMSCDCLCSVLFLTAAVCDRGI